MSDCIDARISCHSREMVEFFLSGKILECNGFMTSYTFEQKYFGNSAGCAQRAQISLNMRINAQGK